MALAHTLRTVVAVATLICAHQAHAVIIKGGLVLDDNAFADAATQLSGAAPSFLGGATSLSEAVVGSNLSTGVFVGADTTFQVDFLDNVVTNGSGADLVIYEVGFDADDVRVAVEVSGVLSAFQTLSTAFDFFEGGLHVNSVLVDLTSFGVSSGASVSRLVFTADAARPAPEYGGFASLNSTAVPEPGTLGLLAVPLLACVARRRQCGSAGSDHGK